MNSNNSVNSGGKKRRFAVFLAAGYALGDSAGIVGPFTTVCYACI